MVQASPLVAASTLRPCFGWSPMFPLPGLLQIRARVSTRHIVARGQGGWDQEHPATAPLLLPSASQSHREHHHKEQEHSKQGEQTGDEDQLPGELHLLVHLLPGVLLLPQLLLHLGHLNAGAGLGLPGPARQALCGRRTAASTRALGPSSTLWRKLLHNLGHTA